MADMICSHSNVTGRNEKNRMTSKFKALFDIVLKTSLSMLQINYVLVDFLPSIQCKQTFINGAMINIVFWRSVSKCLNGFSIFLFIHISSL